MSIEGKIRTRNGKMYVVYATTLDAEPIRISRWWRVVESYSNRYNANRPEDGDTARSEGGGNWSTSNRNGSTGRVTTGDGSTQAEIVEEVPVHPPKSGGKELRWRDGRWEKLMAKGWIPAGEGTSSPKTPRAPRAKKSGAQLQREINDFLGKP